MNLLTYLKLVITDELAELRDILTEHRWLVLFLLAAIVGLFAYLRPFPPTTILVAAGTPGNNYFNIAQSSGHYFKKNGVELRVIETSGSIENALLLSDPSKGIGVALIQGGALSNLDTDKIRSLGSIDYEPLWIFYHKNLTSPPKIFSDLKNLRIGVGPQLGGTQKLFSDVLALNDIKLSDLSGVVHQAYQDNTKDFFDGKLDVVVKVDSYSDPDVQKLLNDPDVGLMPIEHAIAYQKNLPYLYALTLPASSVNIAKNMPPVAIPLIGTTTSLVVKKELHPDIQMLLLVAARDILRSSQSQFFAKRDEFPAYVDPTVEISPTALHYYDHGVPPGMRYLPFWIAGFFSRIWLVALTIIAIAYPISKLNLHLRETRYHMKHHKVYEHLLEVERNLCEQSLTLHELERMANNLNLINREAIHIRVPTGAESKYFDLLQAINLLLTKIKERMEALTEPGSHFVKTN